MSADIGISQRNVAGAHWLRTLMVFVALSATAAFAIQAWFAYGFARYVWPLPVALSVGVPVASDMFIVTIMITSFILRAADLKVRVYIWTVLSVGITTQVGAAWSFEHWRSTATFDHGRLVTDGQHVGVSVAALVPAVLLAAALHSLIIAARHMPAPQPRPAARPRKPRRAAETTTDGPARTVNVPDRPAQTATDDTGRKQRTAAPVPNERRELARKRYEAGDKTDAIAADLGVSRRSVENWTRDLRVTQRDSPGRGIPGVKFQREGALSLKGEATSDPGIPTDLTVDRGRESQVEQP